MKVKAHLYSLGTALNSGGEASPGYSLIWAIQVCAVPKGVVFQSFWPEIGKRATPPPNSSGSASPPPGGGGCSTFELIYRPCTLTDPCLSLERFLHRFSMFLETVEKIICGFTIAFKKTEKYGSNF